MKIAHLLFIFIFSAFELMNCNEVFSQPNKKTQFEESNRKILFRGFISKFKLLSLPTVLNTSCYEANDSLNSRLDMRNDSIFINYVGPAVTVGILPDTTRFYTVIYCTAAACYLPQLTVYEKGGKIISTKSISSGCGSDLGYSCSEILEVKTANKIIVTRTEDRFKQNETNNNGSNHIKSINVYIYSIGDKGIINVKKRKM